MGGWALLVNLGYKMMKRYLLFAVISLGSVFCGATTVSASDWVYVGTSGTGSPYYIDVQSLKRDGDIVTAWQKIDSLKDKFDKDKSEPSYESLNQWDYNCSKRTIYPLYQINRFRNKPDESLNFYSLGYRGGFPVIPDSSGEVLLNFVCSK